MRKRRKSKSGSNTALGRALRGALKEWNKMTPAQREWFKNLVPSKTSKGD